MTPQDNKALAERLTVDALAQEIRRIDGNHYLGAGDLAEALMPFLTREPSTLPADWMNATCPQCGNSGIHACTGFKPSTSSAQVSGGGEVEAVAAEMREIAPTCESDWGEQLREWAWRLSSTPQARPDGGEAVCDKCCAPVEAVWLMPVATSEPADPNLLQYAWARSNLSTGEIAHAYDCIVEAAKQCGQITHPTPAPDAVARLVEAMKGLMRGYEGRMGDWENAEFNDEYNEAVAALVPFTAAQQDNRPFGVLTDLYNAQQKGATNGQE